MKDCKIPMNLQLLAEETNSGNVESKENEVKEKSSEKNGEINSNSGNSERYYSDKEVDDIVAKKYAKWEAKKQAEINEAQELAKMNEQEKLKHKNKKLEEELAQYKNKEILSQMKSTAKNILKEEGISVDDEILNVLVSKDAEKTNKAVKSFSEMYKKAVENGINERLKSDTPKKGSKTSLTKKEILSIKDKKERQKKIAENLNLFE